MRMGSGFDLLVNCGLWAVCGQAARQGFGMGQDASAASLPPPPGCH